MSVRKNFAKKVINNKGCFLPQKALKNWPSTRAGHCLKLRGRVHIVSVTSDRTNGFSGYPRLNSVPKLQYFKT